jgi:Mg2+ and Co2+ transporter CorA
MYSRHEYGNIVWIDLESPARSDIERVIEEFDIHPSVAEELLVPSVTSLHFAILTKLESKKWILS